jgi:NADH-quinone oxidoreductase subunit N
MDSINLDALLNQISESVGIFSPEIFLIFIILGVVVLTMRWRKVPIEVSNPWFYWLLMGLLGLVFRRMLAQQYLPDQSLFDNMLVLDGLGIFLKSLVLLSAIVMLLHGYLLRWVFPLPFFILFLGLLVGLCVLVSSVHLLMIYVAIELVSLMSYLAVGLDKQRQSAEAALKYAIFGSIASAIMLYGMSWLYGITGTLHINHPDFSRILLQENSQTLALWIALSFTLAGFLFKMAASPFHFWAPDVYQTAPTPLVSFFSVAPKLAGLALVARLAERSPSQIQILIAVVALLTLTVGNFSALRQTNIKRLLAYSAVAQSGFLLVGVVALGALGIKAMLFYALIYLFMSMLVFYLTDLWTDENGEINQLRGWGIQRPWVGILWLLGLLALAGLPPTAGFMGKLLLFSGLWDAYLQAQSPWVLGLFGWGILQTVVALFYYLKIPFVLFFKSASSPTSPPEISFSQWVLLGSLSLPLLIFFFYPNGVIQWISSFLE